MATHIHEEEQVEALKRWWKENGTSVIAGVALGLAGIFGWNAWQNHQRTRAEQAAELYAQLVGAAAEGRHELAEGVARRLAEDFDRTAYADFARLLQARVALDQDRPDAARPWLEAVLTGSADPELRHVARLRLARVLAALGRPGEGLTLLDAAETGNPGRFAGQYEEVRGDLYLAGGKLEDAREAYRKAIALGRDPALLRLKLNDLGREPSET